MAWASTQDTWVVDKVTGIIYRVLSRNDMDVLLESDGFHFQVSVTAPVFKTRYEPLMTAHQ